MHDGVVRAIIKDYLGKAVMIEHKSSQSDTGRFISLYAHTNPCPDIKVGMILNEGDIIANLADTSKSNSHIMPHLHLSFGLPSKSFSHDSFVWNAMRTPEIMILIDPLSVLDWPYQALDAADPACRQL